LEEIYLDNAATTKPFKQVVDVMVDCLVNKYGNPSSLHRKGIEAENILKESRNMVAEVLKVQPGEILFTSGGTESNNTAIRGIARSYSNRGRHIISSVIEHPSVYNTLEDLQKDGFSITYLDVDANGLIDLQQLKESIRKDTILVTIMGVNNEIGTIQPLGKIGRLIKDANPLTFFHTDCVQAFMKIPLNPEAMKIDLLSISGHKFHGPKGVGVLYFRKGINLRPWQTGGSQEYGLRSGTENIPVIGGLGKAVEIYSRNFKDYSDKMASLKQRLREGLESRIDDIRFNSPDGENESAPHILSVSFRGVRGEVLVHSLERHDIYISTRSACSSRQAKASNVLTSIGLTSDEIEGTVRIGLSSLNTREEIDKVIDVLPREVENLRKLFRR